MNNLLLPDLFAMVVLLGVLWLVRRRYPQHDIRLWMAGLLLILVECVARILYGIRMPTGPHRTLHAIALDAYLVAGLLFLRSSVRGLQRLPRSTLYLVLYAVPGVVLLTEYGAGLTRRPIFIATALAGLAVTGISTLVLHRPLRYLAGLLAIWLPTVCAIVLWTPRTAIYLLLASVYFATACTFGWSLPRSSSGKVPVIAGFVVWSLCFATHSWIAEIHPGWTNLVSEIWNMQKFLITVGFLLILFERQVESNEWLALHDQLTGLPNRRLFQDRLSSAIARAERDHTALILFYMDLNRFKEVNDTLGHDAGDSLLRNVAESLLQVVRRTDTLARMGGDEFILLATDMRNDRSRKKEGRWLRMRDTRHGAAGRGALPLAVDGVHEPEASPGEVPYAELTSAAMDTEENHSDDNGGRMVQTVTRIEQNLRAAIEKPIRLWSPDGAQTIQVSASIGLAVYPVDGTDPDELCRIADQRMYDDKSGGSMDRVRSFWSK